MNALWHQILQRIIHKAMTGQTAHASEARTHDAHTEVTAFSGTRMPSMGCTVIADLQV
jgi:hypothetical protein